MKTFDARLIANYPVNERYWQMTLDVSARDTPARPGQFFHIRCGDAWKNPLRRPLSVYNYDDELRQLEFLYLIKGSGTEQMTRMKKGDSLNLIGPLGHGFTLPDQGPLLLAARGVGVATLHALARQARAEKRGVHVIISARTPGDLLTVEALNQIGAVVHTVTDQEGTSSTASVRILSEQLIRKEKMAAIYTCGSRRLSKLVQELAVIYHLKGELATEAHMACGIGDCYACACTVCNDNQLKTVRVCTDGPVFPIRQVVLS
ncbi:dihydroorotate dehydrogenase electron transfer subunit [Sporolactobacillus shoreicorticis]|uniref:Dihydroorotate dehydrogenase electron transfer subunit n=1 Tax=Sporolactobacillus shoreicorticis TaxID=1923877 RepID=A0ABW5S4N1_9BACL|nr:dihydroorotate dehydrogenase electron transfer subunit [Sporolactobacillus shoreicorticis]MCO7127132.1 dihydroorotate dehydrogenase electron transfer subunit [Sporolactobacillus shoreicorticis]